MAMNFLLQHSTLLLKIFKKYEINTPLRVAHFLGQLAHESGGFKFLFELGNKAYFNKYEGRKDLGNIYPGDGYKFRGRGFIQITGRANYEAYKKYSGLDVVTNPDLVSQIAIAMDVAGWFWKTKKLNLNADKNDIKGVTKRINGGYNGLAERITKTKYYHSFDVLGDLKKKVQRKLNNNPFNSSKSVGFWNRLFGFGK